MEPWLKSTAVLLFCALFLAPSAPAGKTIQAGRPADILIVGGTVITMDPQRRVLEDTAVAVTGGKHGGHSQFLVFPVFLR